MPKGSALVLGGKIFGASMKDYKGIYFIFVTAKSTGRLYKWRRDWLFGSLFLYSTLIENMQFLLTE